MEFLNRARHVQTCSAATMRFALRLSGIVWNSCEGFHVVYDVDNVLEYLFHEILEKDEFWTDPGVRDSYFKAAFGILRSSDSFVWYRSQVDRFKGAIQGVSQKRLPFKFKLAH